MNWRMLGWAFWLAGTGLVVAFGWGDATVGLRAGVCCSYAGLFLLGFTWPRRG